MIIFLFAILLFNVIIMERANHQIEFQNKLNVIVLMNDMDLIANFLLKFGKKIMKKFLIILSSYNEV